RAAVRRGALVTGPILPWPYDGPAPVLARPLGTGDAGGSGVVRIDPPAEAVHGDGAAVREDPLRPGVPEGDAHTEHRVRVVPSQEVGDDVALGRPQAGTGSRVRTSLEVGHRRP